MNTTKRPRTLVLNDAERQVSAALDTIICNTLAELGGVQEHEISGADLRISDAVAQQIRQHIVGRLAEHAAMKAPGSQLLNLLAMLHNGGVVEMYSRSYLHRRGILEKTIRDADKAGYVAILNSGPLASVILTVEGGAFLNAAA